MLLHTHQSLLHMFLHRIRLVRVYSHLWLWTLSARPRLTGLEGSAVKTLHWQIQQHKVKLSTVQANVVCVFLMRYMGDTQTRECKDAHMDSPHRLFQSRPLDFQSGWPAHWRTRWTSDLESDRVKPGRAAQCSLQRSHPGALLDLWLWLPL